MASPSTSEPLVPTGLPYGERETTRDAMVAADIPLAPPPLGAVSPSPKVPGTAPAAGVPPNFDVFANRDPLGAPQAAAVDPAVSVQQAASASPNAVMQEIAALLPGYLEE